jgi:hypothetical protein
LKDGCNNPERFYRDFHLPTHYKGLRLIPTLQIILRIILLQVRNENRAVERAFNPASARSLHVLVGVRLAHESRQYENGSSYAQPSLKPPLPRHFVTSFVHIFPEERVAVPCYTGK